MQLTLEGWEGGAPVRATLAAPDRAQVQAAERLTLTLRPGMQVVLQQQVMGGGGCGGARVGDSGRHMRAGRVLATAPAAPARLPSPPSTVSLNLQPRALGRPDPACPGVAACVWDGALAVADELCARATPHLAGETVLELGAGVGAAGLAAARLGAAVVLTDRAAALAGLRGNAARNWLVPGHPPPRQEEGWREGGDWEGWGWDGWRVGAGGAVAGSALGCPNRPGGTRPVQRPRPPAPPHPRPPPPPPPPFFGPRPDTPGASPRGCAEVAALEWGAPGWEAAAAAAMACLPRPPTLVLACDVAYPDPAAGGAPTDPGPFAAALAAVAPPGCSVLLAFEARPQAARPDAAPGVLRVGLLEAVGAALGVMPELVPRGDPERAWRPAHVELFECTVPGGGGGRGKERGAGEGGGGV